MEGRRQFSLLPPLNEKAVHTVDFLDFVQERSLRLPVLLSPKSSPFSLCDLHIPREKWLNHLQTVDTLIRCHILWHLIWVCTVCQLLFLGSLDYTGLTCTCKTGVYKVVYCFLFVTFTIFFLFQQVKVKHDLSLLVSFAFWLLRCCLMKLHPLCVILPHLHQKGNKGIQEIVGSGQRQGCHY